MIVEPKNDSPTAANSSLAAVVFVDMVSFTTHVGAQEDATLDFIERCDALFQNTAAKHHGEYIKSTGDGALLVFTSARNAVAYAEEALRALNAARPEGSDYAFRFGIHLGEVRRSGQDVLGHAVNIAARLESEAPSGSICVSEAVISAVGMNIGKRFSALGLRQLKNTPAPMVLYRLDLDLDAPLQGYQPQIEISVIGGFSLRKKGRIETISTSDHARAALCALALSVTGSTTLGELSALAPGPAKTAQDARYRSMSEAVDELTKQMGGAITVEGELVILDRALVSVDLAEVEAGILRGRIDARALSQRGWCKRIADGTASGRHFESWLAAARAEWQDRIARSLELRIESIEPENNPELRNLCEVLFAVEPAHEQAARKLILINRAAGNLGRAARVYEDLVTTLRDRYGIEPQPETTVVAQGGSVTSQHFSQPGTPLRLQVKPFVAQGTASDSRVEDFRNQLLAGLACFRGWAVAESPQVQNPAIGSDYVLSARAHVTTDTDGLQVTFVLSEATSDKVLWSEVMDLDQQSFQEAVRHSVGRIAATLEVYIATDRVARAFESSDVTVVDSWLQGERLIARWTAQSHDEAHGIFEELTRRAPGFALGFSSLASILNGRHIVRPGERRDPDSARLAHSYADIAVELDPLDARNRLPAAWAAALDNNFDLALLNMNVAAKLNPNSPKLLMSCALGFSFLGEHDRALAALARSLEIAPALMEYQWCYAASIHYLAGDAASALEAANKSGDRIFDNLGWTAAALVRLGRHAEATAACSQLIKRMKPIWQGDALFGPKAVTDWFAQAYPIRYDKDRAALFDALEDAMKGINMPD